MAKKEIEVWLQKSIDSKHESVLQYEHLTDYIALGKGVVTIELFEQDETELVVALLKGKIQKERAESEVRVEELQDKIQQLLAIGNDGAGK